MLTSINKTKLRLLKENPLCLTKQVGWDRQNVFAAPTVGELAAGTVWEVNLTTPANTNTATGLPQVIILFLERVLKDSMGPLIVMFILLLIVACT